MVENRHPGCHVFKTIQVKSNFISSRVGGNRHTERFRLYMLSYADSSVIALHNDFTTTTIPTGCISAITDIIAVVDMCLQSTITNTDCIIPVMADTYFAVVIATFPSSDDLVKSRWILAIWQSIVVVIYAVIATGAYIACIPHAVAITVGL